MNPDRAATLINEFWDSEITSSLMDYVRIPSLSPAFDSDWADNGKIDEAMNHIIDWCHAHTVPGMTITRHQLENRTPVLLVEVPGQVDERVLLYGHIDKQPEFSGWSEGLGPWTPVIREDRLYGRGGGDDGYAMYCAIASLHALVDQDIPLPHIAILIEASEESGSPDLPFYMESLGDEIGTPGLVIALDSTCGNYEQLWNTTSLRGISAGVLTVSVLSEGVHSGSAGGIVSSSFRIVRNLLSRLEDEDTGEITPDFLKVDVPEVRMQEADAAAAILKDELKQMYGYQGDGLPVSDDALELILNNTWRASLGIIGADGLPPVDESGNVLRPFTSVKLSLRLPPTTDAVAAQSKLKDLLLRDPPRGCTVTYDTDLPNPGWHAPLPTPALAESLNRASERFFGNPAASLGCGGSIPFMGLLAESYPDAQFVITGVLGPHSNAHGPNEFLDLPTAKKVTGCVAQLIHDWAANQNQT